MGADDIITPENAAQWRAVANLSAKCVLDERRSSGKLPHNGAPITKAKAKAAEAGALYTATRDKDGQSWNLRNLPNAPLARVDPSATGLGESSLDAQKQRCWLSVPVGSVEDNASLREQQPPLSEQQYRALAGLQAKMRQGASVGRADRDATLAVDVALPGGLKDTLRVLGFSGLPDAHDLLQKPSKGVETEPRSGADVVQRTEFAIPDVPGSTPSKLLSREAIERLENFKKWMRTHNG